ncbi:hypothetical protein KR032_002377, partial [Drosophila birchii]
DAVVFRFTNYACKSYNESWFKFNHCRLKAISRERVVLNLNGTILHEAHNIHARFKMYKKANGYKPWLWDIDIDVCRFLRKSYDPFVKLVFGLFKEFSNFNHSCPYVVSLNIPFFRRSQKLYIYFQGLQIIKGFYLKPELLHLPLPTGEYMLVMRWIFDKKLQFDTNASFMFVEDIGT